MKNYWLKEHELNTGYWVNCHNEKLNLFLAFSLRLIHHPDIGNLNANELLELVLSDCDGYDFKEDYSISLYDLKIFMEYNDYPPVRYEWKKIDNKWKQV